MDTPAISQSPDDSPLGDLGTEPARRRWPKVLGGLGIAAIVLAGAYVGAAFYFGDRVPNDTTVAGVEIGGMTAAVAEVTLTEGLADVAAAPVTLAAGDVQATIDPAEVDLALDAKATVAEVTGLSFRPQRLLGHVLGLGAQPAISTVDTEALTSAVEAMVPDFNVAPVEGAITFDGTTPVAVEPVKGTTVDVEATVAEVRDQWLFGESIPAVAVEVEPTIGADAVATAMTTIAEPLTSAPVSVAIGADAANIALLNPEDLVALSVIAPEGSNLVLRIDPDALVAKVYEITPGIGAEPKDATVELQNGAPVVVPAVAGVGLDVPTLVNAVSDAAVSTTNRTAAIELSEKQAEFSTAAAEALGIREKVSEFSTPLTSDAMRTHNLVVGTAAINGTIIKPGETFSLINALGPVTAAEGYNSSPVVVDGFESHAIGGGLSQLSTTTFNAAFEAGMDDVFHKSHSRWFARYPEGREATMFAPDLDMKWRNNTDYGVLVQAWVADGRTWVAFWSTPVWDVTIVTGARYNFTAPRTTYNSSPTCIAESGGSSGFTVQVTRTRSRDGARVDAKTYTTTYQPWNKVVCGSPPAG